MQARICIGILLIANQLQTGKFRLDAFIS